MNNKRYARAVVLILATLIISGCGTVTVEPTTELPNPASAYCEERGYTIEIRTSADGGTYGVCKFSDGSECEEWAFYRGECKPASASKTAVDTPEATPTIEAPVEETPTQVPEPVPTQVVAETPVEDPYPGWGSYVNADYAFAFRYPTTWTLEEEANVVKLSQGTLLLAIAFQRQGEDVPPPWSGMPAGDFESRGTMVFLGQEIDKNALVYEGKVKVLTYSAESGDLMFSIRLEDVVKEEKSAFLSD
jgi:putative hemolysin